MGRKFLKWVNIVTFILSVPSFVFIMASLNHEVSEIQLLMCATIIALCCIGMMTIQIGDMFEEMKEEEQKKHDLEEMNLERQAEEFEEEERQRRIQEFAKWNESFNDL